MSRLEEILQLFDMSESSLACAKAAQEAIHDLHCAYCDLFRNEIDNMWLKQDGRYKMLNKFSKAAEPFRNIIALDRAIQKEKKKKAKQECT